ncbi:MAG: hypothetical protein HUK03_02515 [Bacteroidaceae bacterium]|nr:hypothetical protein [Bacteroidaceae bacterium]
MRTKMNALSRLIKPSFVKMTGFVLTIAAISACNMARENKNTTTGTFNVSSQQLEGTLFATLDKVINADSIQVVSDLGDTLIVKLSNEETMMGDPIVGNRLAITPLGTDFKVAYKIINVSQLIGEWLEPSPLAEGSYTGIDLAEGGAAIAINSQTTEYEDWRLEKDLLLVTYTAKGMDVSELTVDTFNILMLTADSLRLSNSTSRFFFCRSTEIEKRKAQQPTYNRERDEADNYDLFNPEGDSPTGSSATDDGLMTGY